MSASLWNKMVAHCSQGKSSFVASNEPSPYGPVLLQHLFISPTVFSGQYP
uniref:Uncharacterized protein n=1 Tax=Arundo donax TaxID=35708 RepID=A0A0A9BP96_ARUDO